ncbi:SCP-like protein [Ancylostoma caninum]|uniref:SCP-like protein n=1 Tax=Ancylostoma caninum TaxID=29170 RepID=A0A368GS04_ANCCA|nr:SCP-like protein [Ancylostoma caninum]
MKSLAFQGIAVIAHILVDVPISTATEFGCKDTLISDKWREAVLNFHNNNRRRIAEGNQVSEPGKVMPFAKDMNQLYWDCNIEYNAYLINCEPTKAGLPQDYGKISANINLGGKCTDPEGTTRTVLQNLWNEVKLKDLSANPAIDPATQENFGIMANGPTTGFACTYNKKCSNNLVCLYNKEPSTNNQANVLYETVADAADICNGCDCVNHLCTQNPYKLADDTYPLSLCSNPQQSDDGMTNEMQATAEDMVNYYRRLVGSGWAPDKNGYALPAKKMIAVGYDCDTADIGTKTKTLAATCQAPYAPTAGYSVSYYEERNLTKTRLEVLREGIKRWAEQSKLVDLGETVTFTGDIETTAPDFAEMVDEQVTRVVCSVTDDDCLKQGFRVAVCQYNNPITSGDTVYTTGKTCSACPTGLKCDNDIGGGLCDVPR